MTPRLRVHNGDYKRILDEYGMHTAGVLMSKITSGIHTPILKSPENPYSREYDELSQE